MSVNKILNSTKKKANKHYQSFREKIRQIVYEHQAEFDELSK